MKGNKRGFNPLLDSPFYFKVISIKVVMVNTRELSQEELNNR